VKILALDPATKTGWALGEDGKRVASGTWDLAPTSQRRFEGGGMRWLRLRRLLDEVAGVPGLVVFEEVRRHAGVDAAHAYGGALAEITAWCEAHSVPYQAVPVGQIKKFATGRGNADKPAMIEAARNRWGVEPVDDNEADAVALLHLAIAEFGKGAVTA
jgi:crossover junction endodeoxyribonuclease RuvC